MSTLVETKSSAAASSQRLVLWDVGWHGYQSLLRIVGDRPIRATYDRGNVELMSPSPRHERKKSLFGRLVRILAAELSIPIMPVGSTTLTREDVDRGLEADEAFYLGNLERIRDPDAIDLDIVFRPGNRRMG